MNMHVRAPSARVSGPSRDRLTPTQQLAFDQASLAIKSNPIVLLESAPGMGKTTVLRAMHQVTGGKYLNASDVFRAHQRTDPAEYEQVVYDVIRSAIETDEFVYFDNVADYQAASHYKGYPRPNLF